MAIVPSTRVEYTGDGIVSLYAFSFPYEAQSDVYVTVDGVITAFTFSTDSIVSILPAPANLSSVVIYRDTPALNIRYVFDSGVPFLTKFADTNWQQLLYIFQEFVNENILNKFDLTKTLRTLDVLNILPDAATRADKIVGFDGAGQPIVLSYLSSSIPGIDARLTVVESYVNILNAGRLTTIPTFNGLSIVPATIGQTVFTSCHTLGSLGAGRFNAVDSTGLTPDGGNISASATVGVYWKRVDAEHHAHIDNFGGNPDGSVNNDAAFLAARNSLRHDPQPVQQNSGGSAPTITAYASGTIEFGRGVYVISKNVMNITQDMGLIMQGQGSRGNNLSIRGATVLLCKDAASNTDFFINHYGNGARSLRLRDLDICYEFNTFTGVLIDSFDSPGLKMESCYAGTNALTSGTRLTSCFAILRATYEEFLNIKNCVFSGAQYGYYPDYTRFFDGSTFGGFGVLFDTTTFYDFVVDHVRVDSARTKAGLKFINCSFNPINTGPNRALNLSNVSNVSVDNCQFVPSTGAGAVVTEWCLFDNCQGEVKTSTFGNFTSAGTIRNLSCMSLTANQLEGTEGWALVSGIINASGNRFRNVTNGYLIAPSGSSLVLSLGVDEFKSTVTSSYYLPTDSTLVSGVILYSTASDNSISKFSVLSPRVRVKSASGKVMTSASAALNISKLDTGDTIMATGVVNQVFTLPDPEYCTEFEIGKLSATGTTLTINASAGKNFIVGAAGTRTSALMSNIGGALKFKALNQNTWQIVSEVGTWTYT